jgi:hypothetical protein
VFASCFLSELSYRVLGNSLEVNATRPKVVARVSSRAAVVWLSLWLLGGGWAREAQAQPRTPRQDAASRQNAVSRQTQRRSVQPVISKEQVAGGWHWRLTTPHGPVHVWRPAAYQRASAGIVLYVHGYYIGVDKAWQIFHLAEQFKASRQNAMFIVPEAPQGPGERLTWDTLAALLQTVSRGLGQRLPRGHVVALAHSGGYRTAAAWLAYKWLDHVFLLDALYSGEDAFRAWIDTDEHRDQHKLILVGADTRQQGHAFIKGLSYARSLPSIPTNLAELKPRQRRARLLYLDSQYNHNQMIENGQLIPLLLRLTRLKRL